jgi:hypothetical protein
MPITIPVLPSRNAVARAAIAFLLLGTQVVSLAAASGEQGLQIVDITAPASVVKHGKFEAAFTVSGSVASNPQMPYDPAPPPGIAANWGITVNAEFTRNGFQTVHTIPAFLYQEFEYEVKGGRDWFRPLDQYSWKVRFSPPQEGTWQYRLTATDAGGSTTSATRSLAVLSSSERGFVRVSTQDPRYFEFEDGSLFLGLGYNGGIDWFSPVRTTETRLTTMGQSGVSLSRIWLSQSGIFGSAWNPWYGLRGDYGGYIPRTGVTPAGSPATVRVRMTYAESGGNQNTGYFEACRFIGGFQAATAVMRQTTYRFRVKYASFDITGPRNTAFQNHGFVLKMQNPADGNWHRNCYDAGAGNSTGMVISPYAGNAADEAWLEGTWNSGNNDFLPPFYMALENVNATNPANGRIPAVYVSYVEIRQVLSDGTLTGPNIVAKPSMEHHKYFEQRFSYAFDRILEVARQQGVYLKVVVLEKDEDILSQLQPNGEFGAASSANFYGNYRSMTATRWLQQAWWRYLQARWGYSPNIHSWELVNEGDPNFDRHYTLADELGKYMRQFAPNQHLVTTSFWHSLPANAFWKNATYPNLDYADLHAYVSTSQPSEFNVTSAKDPVVRTRCGTNNGCFKTSMTNDAALYHAEHSLQALDRALGKPLVRGESGLDAPNQQVEDANLARDTNGVWLHNLVWSSVNPGAMYDLYWWLQNLRQRPGPDGSTANGLHEIFTPFRDFMADVPLNNGQYRDLAPTTSRPDDVRVLGQKDTSSGRAHAWIQNRRHTWCAVVGGVADCPYTWDGSRLAGTVTIGGFAPSVSYQVQWVTFDAAGAATQPAAVTQAANASGNLVLVLDQLPATVVDAAVKIRPMSTTGIPSAPRNLRIVPGSGSAAGAIRRSTSSR